MQIVKCDNAKCGKVHEFKHAMSLTPFGGPHQPLPVGWAELAREVIPTAVQLKMIEERLVQNMSPEQASIAARAHRLIQRVAICPDCVGMLSLREESVEPPEFVTPFVAAR